MQIADITSVKIVTQQASSVEVEPYYLKAEKVAKSTAKYQERPNQ